MSQKYNTWNGIWFTALFAFASLYITSLSFIRPLGISPLIAGIILGMIYANTLRSHLPAEWVPGIQFSAKKILRFGIILYGFNVSFQQIVSAGTTGLALSILIVVLTLLLGIFVGRILKLDKDTTLLTSAGSSVCGAAAVLATESVLKSEPHKAVVAVSTVVLFGTISIFLYPAVYASGVTHLSDSQFGLYIGGSIHEVAQVVAAGNAVSEDAERNAIIVKMTRVLLLVPMLLALGLFFRNRSTGGKMSVPWFAVWFLAVAAFNSLLNLPQQIISAMRSFDIFLLTMAMSALGMESSYKKMKLAGWKPFLLAFILFLFLIFGGYAILRILIEYF